MTAALRVVATPIGNVADLSARAREALASAALILAEDTRNSGALMSRLGISVRLLSCHAHNERDRVPVVLERLEAGESVALISDAGAPAISDPGGRLVDEVVRAGHRVEVFPGPSAPVAALMGAGLDASRYVFVGFVPRAQARRRALLAAAGATGMAVVAFEAVQRLSAWLEDAHAVLGERRVVVGRELTKLHETFHRGVLGGPLDPPLVEKGECVIVVEAGEAVDQAGQRALDDDAPEVQAILSDHRRPPKARAKALANLLGISTKEAYTKVSAHAEEGAPSDEAGSASPPLDEPSLDEPSRDEPSAEASGAAASVQEVIEHLAAAARTLASIGSEPGGSESGGSESGGSESAAAGGPSSEIPGADQLMAWLGKSPLPLAAPVEGQETGKAILSALSAADSLLDGLQMFEEAEALRTPNPGGPTPQAAPEED